MSNLSEELIILNEDNDLFGTYNKAKAMIEFLELEENRNILSKNNMIALYGNWGSGKSSVLKTIKENINKEKFEIVWFDTWKYEKDVNLPFSLLKFIITKGKIGNIEKVSRGFFSIFAALTNDLKVKNDFLEVSADYKNIYEKIKKENKSYKCLWEEVKDFEDCYKHFKAENDERLIVILDDLDRCDSENIITLISSIKLLLSINENIIFILGIDKNAVTLALKNKYGNDMNKANEYLEKIFPISFELNTNINNSNMESFVRSIMETNEDDAKYIIKLFDKLNIKDPRKIKKIFRKYQFIKNTLLHEGIDLTNKYNLCLILYLIILNSFYENEYKNIFINKDFIYENIRFFYQGTSKNIYPYNQISIVCNYLGGGIAIEKNIFPLLKIFTPTELKTEAPEIKLYNGEPFLIFYTDWKNAFKSNILIDFVDYIISDNQYLEYFFDNNKFKQTEIEKLLLVVDNLL